VLLVSSTRHSFSGLTGAGACPSGHCRLAVCPGDRILRSRIRIRSRIMGSNHFAFQSLAAVASGQIPGLVRFLGASPLGVIGVPTTSGSNTRHLPADRVLRLQ
jgi:hypothetical protein